MGVGDKWMCSKESSVIINSLLLILLFGFVATLPVPSCGKGQKQRTDENDLPICCYTVFCNTSQDFGFCSTDQGYDFCIDCPPNMYSNDRVNTYIWDKDSKVDVCIPKPECKAVEVVMVGNACQCNLGNGHWGRDPNNCQPDRNNCKGAGYQLDLDGDCNECSPDKFKPEPGVYGTCRDKRRCTEDEVEIDPGSKKSDRTCKKKVIEDTTTTVVVPTTTTEPLNPTDGKETGVSTETWLIPLLLVCLIIAIILIYRHREKLKDYIDRQCCCQRHTCNKRHNVAEEGQPMLLQNGIHQNGLNSDNNTNSRSRNSPIESDDTSLLRNTNQQDDGTELCDGDQTNVKGEVEVLSPDVDSSHTDLSLNPPTGQNTGINSITRNTTDLTMTPLTSQNSGKDFLPTNRTDLSSNPPTGQNSDNNSRDTDGADLLLNPLKDHNHGNDDDQGNVKTNINGEYITLLSTSLYNDSLNSQNPSMSPSEVLIAPRSPPSIPYQAQRYPTNGSQPNGNIPQDETTQEKSVYDTAELGNIGNIPHPDLLNSLNTMSDNSSSGVFHTALIANDPASGSEPQKDKPAENSRPNNKKIQLPTVDKNKDRPQAAVAPMVRSQSTGNQNQDVPANNGNEQFPPSATTAYGQDVQQATNEENTKVVANSEYPEEWRRQPTHVDIGSRENDGNGTGNNGIDAGNDGICAGNDGIGARNDGICARNDGIGARNDGIDEIDGNGVNGENNTNFSLEDNYRNQGEQGQSLNNDYVQVYTGIESQPTVHPVFNRTTSGNVVAIPESDNDNVNETSSRGVPDEDRTRES